MRDVRVYIGNDKKLTANMDLCVGDKLYIDGAWYEVSPLTGYGQACAHLLIDGVPCHAWHAVLDYQNGCWECTSYMQGDPNEVCSLDYYFKENDEEEPGSE